MRTADFWKITGLAVALTLGVTAGCEAKDAAPTAEKVEAAEGTEAAAATAEAPAAEAPKAGAAATAQAEAPKAEAVAKAEAPKAEAAKADDSSCGGNCGSDCGGKAGAVAAEAPAKAEAALASATDGGKAEGGCGGCGDPACGGGAEVAAADEAPKAGHYGAAFTLTEGTPLAKALEGATAGDSTPVRMTGEIKSVCKKKGCWMVLADGDTKARVTFKDYGFTVPIDAKGQATVEGIVKVKEHPEAMAKHLAEDAGKDPSKVKGSLREYMIVATAVQIGQ